MAEQKIRILASVLCMALLCGCGCRHPMLTAADCTEPARCVDCGKAQGSPLGHDWLAADCVYPKTCDRCGKTIGQPKEHKWLQATESRPQTCGECGLTTGLPLEKEEEPLSWDQVLEMVCKSLAGALEEFEPEFDYKPEQDVLYVSLTAEPGTAVNIVQAPRSLEEKWKEYEAVFCSVSEQACLEFRNNGFETDCCIMLLSDANSEKALLAAYNGSIKYDVFDE